MARQRDYKAEYARRIARGLEQGRSRQEARGHKPPPGRTEYQVRRGRALVRARDAAEETPERTGELIGLFGGDVGRATRFLAVKGKLRDAYKSYDSQEYIDALQEELHSIDYDDTLSDDWYYYH